MKNEITTTEQRPMMSTGSRPTAIVPTNLDQVAQLSRLIVESGLAPRELNTPQKVGVAIMHGLEIGLTPMAALQRIAVVNGRPCLWGDGVVALVRASGLCEYISEWIEGDGDGRVAICETKRKGEKAAIVRTFSVGDAKTAKLWAKGGPWQQFPERMLAMRARAFALRDTYADVLGGLYLREELEEDNSRLQPATYVETPVAEHQPAQEEKKPARAVKTKAAPKVVLYDEETSPEFLAEMKLEIANCASREELRQWSEDNAERKARLLPEHKEECAQAFYARLDEINAGDVPAAAE